jgi:hypothetical protein
MRTSLWVRKALRLLFLILLAQGFVSIAAASCYVLLGNVVQETRDLATLTRVYSTKVSGQTPAVKDHHLGLPEKQRIIYPSTAYLDGIFAAAVEAKEKSPEFGVAVLEGIEIGTRYLLLNEENSLGTHVAFHLHDKIAWTFDFEIGAGKNGASSQRNYLKGRGHFEQNMTFDRKDFEFSENGEAPSFVDSAQMYAEMAKRGLTYGDMYRGLSNIYVQGDICAAEVVPHADINYADHAVPPAILDIALHATAAVVMNHSRMPPGAGALPKRFGHVEFNTRARLTPGQSLPVYLRVKSIAEDEKGSLRLVYNLLLTTADGEPVVYISDGELAVVKP